MKQIYLVQAEWHYEGSTTIRAFASEARANDFRNKCANHHDKRTWYEGDDYECAAYEKWSAKYDKWRESHPGGQSAVSADSFGVYAVYFDNKEPKP